ncbi:PREDICTED: coiled-coil domain-containing protein 12, partial [Phaethon lepturus]
RTRAQKKEEMSLVLLVSVALLGLECGEIPEPPEAAAAASAGHGELPEADPCRHSSCLRRDLPSCALGFKAQPCGSSAVSRVRIGALCVLICSGTATLVAAKGFADSWGRELKLRNYEPEDEELKKRKVPQAKPASVEDKVKDQLEAAKPEPIIDEVDLANLAPRKPDWDLKRDVAKKLEKLEKRTQRAIAELIRERLKGQEEELASAVGSAKQEGSDSD